MGYSLLLGLLPQPLERRWVQNPHGIVLELTSLLGHPVGRDQGPDTFIWERSRSLPPAERSGVGKVLNVMELGCRLG